jgi:ureidoacrylate peracid hydrolase
MTGSPRAATPVDDRDLVAALVAGTAALVVIDVQNDFCHPDGAMAAQGADVSANIAMLGPLRTFVDLVRAVGGLIVFVRLVRSDEHRPLPVRGVPPAGVCDAGSWGARLVDGLVAAPGDLVVHKTRYSAFLATDLELQLRAAGVQTLLTVGTTANVCVDSTVRDAAQRGFAVVILEDLVGYVRQELAESALANLGLYFADVRNSQPLAALLATARRDVPKRPRATGSAG